MSKRWQQRNDVRRSIAATALVFFVELAMAALPLVAQDADTIVLKDDNKKFSLVSQIEDPKEATAFLAIVKTTNPATRYGLAKEFLQTYPQSWLLAQVGDVAARSAIDLGKFDEALVDGRFSLRLLPENPSLLILMANVEAQKRLFGQAIRDADDALDYLSTIERPPNMTRNEWDKLQPQLQASAYFARARAKAAERLAPGNPAKSLESALDDLDRAAAWNSVDDEVFYLRAMVEVRMGQNLQAASDLAYVVQNGQILQEKAKATLSILFRQIASKGETFESFLKRLPAREVDETLRRKIEGRPYPDVIAAGYAGPEACRACHTSEYTNWRKTGMARMLQPYRPENVLGDFSAGTYYSEGSTKEAQSNVIRLGSRERPYFELWSRGGWNRYYVDFTIGSKWQQAYATKLPDGRLQVFPIEYNLREKKWINYWKMIDPPGSERAIIENFPKLSPATNYQQNCAICHTSQLKVEASSPDPMQHAVYLQPGIDCEMCHGPSAWHVKHVGRKPVDLTDATRPPFDFRKATNRDGVRVCAQCHRQSAVREIGSGGEMNYSANGSFVPTTWMRPLDAFSRKAFYKDGRFRETTFIVEAFTRSACYRRGTAQCATCHSPHLGDFDTNQTSLKYRSNPNEMCLSCHSTYRSRIAEHSHHPKGSEASQCVTCHMPRIANALLFQARSHQIEIPSADLTERFGQLESPNVCLTCHSGKQASWANEQLAQWHQ